MKLLFAATSCAILFFAGCVTTPPREVLSAPAQTLIVTALEPTVQGLHVGTTVFQNDGWTAAPDGFNANGIALVHAPKILTQSLPVVDGSATVLGGEDDRTSSVARKKLADQLLELGRLHNAERLVLLTTASEADWISGTNQRLQDIGLYSRGFFGMRRTQVYGVFQLKVFDCRSQAFSAIDKVVGAQEVYPIEWRPNWTEFTRGEQQRIIAAWTEMVRTKTAELLTRAGLANEPLPEKPTLAEAVFLKPKRPTSWLPQGNVLPVPPGMTLKSVRAAVSAGLRSRGWTPISESDAEVVGIYRDGKKEAGRDSQAFRGERPA